MSTNNTPYLADQRAYDLAHGLRGDLWRMMGGGEPLSMKDAREVAVTLRDLALEIESSVDKAES